MAEERTLPNYFWLSKKAFNNSHSLYSVRKPPLMAVDLLKMWQPHAADRVYHGITGVEKMELLHNPAKAMTLAYRRADRTTAAVLPSRTPLQMDLDFDQVTQFDQGNNWPNMD